MEQRRTKQILLRASVAGLLLASAAPLRAETAPPSSQPSSSQPSSQPSSSQPAGDGIVDGVMDELEDGRDPALSRLEPAPPTPPPIALHEGFALRLMLGMGYHSVFANSGGKRLEIDGPRLAFDFAIGGKVVTNFLLHANIIILHDFSPRFRVDGGPSATTEYGSATLYCFGGGGTYYFMPHNIFISVALTGGLLKADPVSGLPEETDFGFVGELLVGKEWRVWRRLALGLAGQFLGGVIPGKGRDPIWAWLGGGAVVTATWN